MIKHYKIIMMDVAYLEEAAVLFNQYRQFYAQESSIQAAYSFLSERVKNKDSIIYLAMNPDSKKIMGFMQLYPSFSSVSLERLWILNDLYVLPEVRKQGIGKALIKKAQTWVRQQNAKGLSLRATIDNYNAQKLYRAQGFEQDKEFFHYFWKCN